MQAFIESVVEKLLKVMCLYTLNVFCSDIVSYQTGDDSRQNMMLNPY